MMKNLSPIIATYLLEQMGKLSAIIVLSILSLGSVKAALTIDFVFDSSVSAENRAIFQRGADFWEDVITGYADGVSRTLTINTATFELDISQGGILGGAGPQGRGTFTADGTTYSHSTSGIALFNVDPSITGGTGLVNELVVQHEIGHVLGIGTLWVENNLYVQESGIYTGSNALEGYNQELGQNASFVPIELDGLNPGTANAHWNMSNDINNENAPGPDSHPGDNGPPLTVISGPNAGLSFDDALMTGIFNPNMWLSDTSLGGLRDLGFTTVDFRSTPLNSTIPEPSAAFLFALGLTSILRLRRRQA